MQASQPNGFAIAVMTAPLPALGRGLGLEGGSRARRAFFSPLLLAGKSPPTKAACRLATAFPRTHKHVRNQFRPLHRPAPCGGCAARRSGQSRARSWSDFSTSGLGRLSLSMLA